LPLALPAAIAMAWGAVIGRWLPGEPGAVTAIGAVVVVVGVASARRRVRRRAVVAFACLAGAVLAMLDAAAPRAVTVDHVAPGPVLLRGTLESAPRPADAGVDAMSPFAPREASQTFILDVTASGTGGRADPMHGTALVRVAGLAPLPGRGSVVMVRGWAEAGVARANPGTRAREPTVTVEVPSATLVRPCDDGWPGDRMVALRAAVHAALARSMPGWATEGERALVAAMTVGTRLPGLAPHARDFRDAGMSHVLAISGFNVAVLVAAAAIATRAAGLRSSGRSWVALGVAAGFLAITEPETSVLRAGFGAALAAVAALRGGRSRGLGVLGATAIVAMSIDVGCIRGAGFQLSYGVVAALLVVAPRATERWSARVDTLVDRAFTVRTSAHEAMAIGSRAIAASACASMVAWTVSTPIAMAHGGSLSPLAAPLSVITMPAAALATVGGVAAAGIHGVWPTAGDWCGAVAAVCARFLASVASAVATAVPSPEVSRLHPAVAMATIAATCAAWLAARRAVRALAWSSVVAVAFASVLAARAPGPPPDAHLQVESLAVGTGHCTLVRAGDTAVLVDAGGSQVDVGSRVVVPFLRVDHVRRLDAVVLTSAALGSVAAVPEVLASTDVDALVAWSPAMTRLDGDHEGPGKVLRDAASRHRTVIDRLEDGVVRRIGDIELCLHAGATAAGRPRIDAVDVRPVTPAGARWIRLRRAGAQRADPAPSGCAELAPPTDAALRLDVDRDGSLRSLRWSADGWTPVAFTRREGEAPAAAPRSNRSPSRQASRAKSRTLPARVPPGARSSRDRARGARGPPPCRPTVRRSPAPRPHGRARDAARPS
jgi:competence protein ComEC